MTRHFIPLLIMVSMLLMMTACGTSPTQPVEPPIETDIPVQPEEPDQVAEQIRPGFLKDPSQRSLSEVMELTRSMPFYQVEVALEIIRSLESLDSSTLDEMISSQRYDPEFTEWLELAHQLRRTMIQESGTNAAARHWANYHYGHPVTQSGFIELVSAYRSFYPVPAVVAVLLPIEGGLSSASAAIRDGLLSAYLERPDESSLRFYPSGRNGESAIQAYQQARDDGANYVIGPLRLDSTKALAAQPDLDVPVLMLNKAEQVEQAPPKQGMPIHSLSLSQSEEAVAIARAVLEQGQKNAVVVVPSSAWGKRIGEAFSTEFQTRGGSIAASAEFDRSQNDYSDMLTRLLKIDESVQRKQALQAQIGTPLGFEPIRRSDFDFIFLAASPQEGRELKPLLRFHDAGDVPVYSIGRVYNGRGETARDQDLDGIVFTAIPWQIGPDATEGPMPASLRDGLLGKLYALGQDAWRLLPWLPLMHKDPGLSFPGQVGELKLQPNGEIDRQPAWAQFVEGTPTPYQWPQQP